MSLVSLLPQLPPMSERTIKPFGPKLVRLLSRPVEKDCSVNIWEGAVRSAKTWGLHDRILGLTALQAQGKLGGRLVLFGATKSTVYTNVLQDLFSIVGEGNYGYNRQNGELDLFGIPWLVVGAKDEGSEKIIRGSTIGGAVGDELVLIQRSFFMMLRTRMSVDGARLYASTNPDTPFHYVKKELMDNKAMIAEGDLHVEHFTLDDNPNLRPLDYRAKLERQFPPGSLYYQRFVQGLWVTGEGSIYKDVWGEHLLYQDTPWTMSNGKPGLVTPKHLRTEGCVERAIPVDCGVTHVQVYGDVIDDGDVIWFDREYWWDSEIAGRAKTDSEYRKDLQAFQKPIPDSKVIIPPECASFKAELEQAGIWHVEADNEVDTGIKMVASMMALGKVRFRRPPDDYFYDPAHPIHDHVGETIKDLQTYLWNAKAKARGEEQPLKVKDDGSDMVRYKIKTDIPAWRIASAA